MGGGRRLRENRAADPSLEGAIPNDSRVDNSHLGRSDVAGFFHDTQPSRRRFRSFILDKGKRASLRRPGGGQPGAQEPGAGAGPAAFGSHAGLSPDLHGVPWGPPSRNDGRCDLRPALVETVQSGFCERIEVDSESRISEAAGERKRGGATVDDRQDVVESGQLHLCFGGLLRADEWRRTICVAGGAEVAQQVRLSWTGVGGWDGFCRHADRGRAGGEPFVLDQEKRDSSRIRESTGLLASGKE